MTGLQERVAAWHVRRFPHARREHVALKSAEEIGEVASAVNGYTDPAWGRGNVSDEAADVIITLFALVGRWYPDYDLLDEVERKLAVLCDPTSGHRVAARSLDG